MTPTINDPAIIARHLRRKVVTCKDPEERALLSQFEEQFKHSRNPADSVQAARLNILLKQTMAEIERRHQ